MSEVARVSRSDRESAAEAAALHAAQIHLGVLPLLGTPFMARLYREIAGAPRSGVWAVREQGTVLAFLAGCADAGATYRRVLLAAGLPLAARACLRLLASRELRRKVASALRYLGRGPEREGEGHAELLAIAVAPGRQGEGLGRRLVEAFEAALLEWRVEEYWVSTNIEETVSNRFYRSVGFVPAGTVSHHDLTLQRYRKRLSDAP